MTYQSKILDHLGLVAAMFDELEIGDKIDQTIAQDFARRGLTVGQAVKAMVLNGLGFVNQRLYLVPRFFETKPTERLLGEQLQREVKQEEKAFRELTERVFTCRADAEGALMAFAARLKATTTEAVEVLECEHVGVGDKQAQARCSFRLRGQLSASPARRCSRPTRARRAWSGALDFLKIHCFWLRRST